MLRRIALALVVVVSAVIVPISTSTAATNRWPHAVVNGFSTASGKGYWLVYQDGSVATAGDARFYGDASRLALAGPIVGGAITPDGRGYWLVAMDGGIFTYGSARFYGSMGATRLNQPVFSMAPTATGRGYWLVARDGGMFSFGDTRFYGSMGATRLNQPINGITRSASGHGYRMVASDGGIFSFGDARFYGSLLQRGVHTSDVAGMAASPSNKGYWIARADGSVYPFGDARPYSSSAASPYDPIQAIFANPKANGYRLVSRAGSITSYGIGAGFNVPPPNSSNGVTHNVRDAQCTAAQSSCTMTFQETALDKNPRTGAAFKDPKPGLLSGYTDSNLTNVTAMSAACAAPGSSENCGYTSHYTSAHNGRTFFFHNCIVNHQIVIDTNSTVRLYFTNCHVYLERTYNNNANNVNQGWGWIGKGGSLNFVHDLFDGQHISGYSYPGDSTSGSCGGTACHPLNVILEGNHGNSVYYSEFSDLPDPLTVDYPADVQWNYFHNNACASPNCRHTDGIQDYWGGANTAANHPNYANNYFSCSTCDSSQALNLTDDFGNNQYAWFVNNKVITSNQNSTAVLVAQQNGNTVANIHVTGNMFFANATHGAGQLLRLGSCAGTLPNACIVAISGNTKVNAAGGISSWP